MLRSILFSSVLVSPTALIIVGLCACANAESPKRSSSASGEGAAGTLAGSAGFSGGASGQAAIGGAGGAGGTLAQADNPTGGSGGMANAGTGGQGAMAGTTGEAGNAGSAAAAGTSGDSAGAGGSNASDTSCEVAPITADMRSSYPNMDDPYYTKYAATSGGMVVATGSQVSDEAIVRYCKLLSEMWSNETVRQSAIAEKMWFTMISQDEQLSSLPQINQAYGTTLNARARGLGALTPTICAEDSIMCMPGDPWVGDCICPHETGHTLYSSGIAKNPELSSRLTAITNSVRAAGRLANAYVWQDGDESGMMSWGVQAWYNCAINGTNGAYHSDINTRAELQKELPEFYQFLSELLPTENKYDDCYAQP